MNVTAMLAWWDEPPELLEQAVLSLAGFADSLVAYDGGYKLVPNAKPASPKKQSQTILSAAKRAGLAARLGKPRLWEGQVEKRNAMLQDAARKADWLLPFDADWVLCGDIPAARAEVEACEFEAMQFRFKTPADPDRSPDETGASDWHREMIGQTIWISFLFRKLDNMSVEGHHWSYLGTRKDGTRVAMDVDATTTAFKTDVWVEHRCHFRDPKRILRNQGYCEARDDQVRRLGVEA